MNFGQVEGNIRMGPFRRGNLVKTLKNGVQVVDKEGMGNRLFDCKVDKGNFVEAHSADHHRPCNL